MFCANRGGSEEKLNTVSDRHHCFLIFVYYFGVKWSFNFSFTFRVSTLWNNEKEKGSSGALKSLSLFFGVLLAAHGHCRQMQMLLAAFVVGARVYTDS